MSEKNHMIDRTGDVNPGEIEDVVSRIGVDKQEEILENFDGFKKYLREKVEVGKKIGLSEEQLAKTTERVANYLADHVNPKNREEYLLQELWKSGDKQQQHALAHMLLNMVEKE
ncbi:DUF3243 domain-containing protein [Metabacillus sp. KIGAM252]|uniref:DUF3243 domain-containing protein n=1 Tax=Metabacillus flavus TaxID=2823519 RepID=A0ABS5LHP5_9BACI|nr:DUF3243 domain-containing protein [Metabacillus flavus]MBS2970280.1 DUF3243 domain-containing protein [Metabacillus flavus]